MKKRVLQVVPTLCGGGAEKMVIDLSKTLENNGYCVKIVSLYDRSFSAENRLTEVKKNETDVVFLNKRKGFDYRMIIELNKIISEFKPNVIHSHLGSYQYVEPVSFIKRIKHIHTVHYAGIGSESTVFKTMLKLSHNDKNFKLVLLSDSIFDNARVEYPKLLKQMCVIRNGVDLSNYLKKKRVYDKNAYTYICVASLTEVKNHTMLISAFASVEKENKRSDQLILVGDGLLREKLEKQVIDENIQKQVEFTGNISNVGDYLNKADYFVLSSHTEGIPLAVIEAMSSGLPIIAPRVGGLTEMVSDNGILFKVDDLNELKNALMNTMFNNEKSNIMSIQSIHKSKNYDLNEMAKNYAEIYE